MLRSSTYYKSDMMYVRMKEREKDGEVFKTYTSLGTMIVIHDSATQYHICHVASSILCKKMLKNSPSSGR